MSLFDYSDVRLKHVEVTISILLLKRMHPDGYETVSIDRFLILGLQIFGSLSWDIALIDD